MLSYVPHGPPVLGYVPHGPPVLSYVPWCELRVKWTKPEKPPVELIYGIKLLGAKEPANVFTLGIKPLHLSGEQPSPTLQLVTWNPEQLVVQSKIRGYYGQWHGVSSARSLPHLYSREHRPLHQYHRMVSLPEETCSK